MTGHGLEFRRRRAEDLRGLIERRACSSPPVVAARPVAARDASTGSELARVGGEVIVWGDEYAVADPPATGFWETIERGACTRTLSENPDLVLNALHGAGLSGLPMGRTASGTLTVNATPHGLDWWADLDPADLDVQTLLPKLRRGDLDGASFAFRVTSDSWDESYLHRKIQSLTLSKGDISIVPFGAQPRAYAKLLSDSPQRMFVPDYSAREHESLALARHGLYVPRRDPQRAPTSDYARVEREQLARLRKGA